MSFSQDLNNAEENLSFTEHGSDSESRACSPTQIEAATPLCSQRSEQPRDVGAKPKRRSTTTESNYKGRARGWCFTANLKEKPDSLDNIKSNLLKLYNTLGCGYTIGGLERAPTTGTYHVQGYVFHKNKISGSRLITVVQTIFGQKPHIEPARGTPQENQTYCSKDGSYFEFGELPKQGSRSDLASLAEAIIAGESLTDIAADNPSDYIRYHGGIKALHLLTHSKPRNMAVDPIVHWWFGPTGVGKSRKAFEMFGDSAYVKMNDKWWDGYIGQSQVIFDDYRPSLCPFHELLRILDRYPYRVQPKGGSIELSATVFVVTTCSRPEALWHSRTDEQLNQLLRRITHIVEFTTTGEEKILKEPGMNYVPLTREELQELFPTPPPEPKLIF